MLTDWLRLALVCEGSGLEERALSALPGRDGGAETECRLESRKLPVPDLLRPDEQPQMREDEQYREEAKCSDNMLGKCIHMSLTYTVDP